MNFFPRNRSSKQAGFGRQYLDMLPQRQRARSKNSKSSKCSTVPISDARLADESVSSSCMSWFTRDFTSNSESGELSSSSRTPKGEEVTHAPALAKTHGLESSCGRSRWGSANKQNSFRLSQDWSMPTRISQDLTMNSESSRFDMSQNDDVPSFIRTNVDGKVIPALRSVCTETPISDRKVQFRDSNIIPYISRSEYTDEELCQAFWPKQSRRRSLQSAVLSSHLVVDLKFGGYHPILTASTQARKAAWTLGRRRAVPGVRGDVDSSSPDSVAAIDALRYWIDQDSRGLESFVRNLSDFHPHSSEQNAHEKTVREYVSRILKCWKEGLSHDSIALLSQRLTLPATILAYYIGLADVSPVEQ
jgi:hypothetical protein